MFAQLTTNWCWAICWSQMKVNANSGLGGGLGLVGSQAEERRALGTKHSFKSTEVLGEQLCTGFRTECPTVSAKNNESHRDWKQEAISRLRN